MKRLALLMAVAVGALGCSATPNILPTNDFNRPMDIAFMCLGAFDTDNGVQVSGRPMRACHPTTGERAPAADPKPSKTTRTFAFLPNAASGDLSVIDGDKWKIVDLSLNSSGYGRVPLGALPEQISASDDGCRLVTANRGSCDLTVVDPSALLGPIFKEYGDAPALDPQGVQTRRVTTANGTELAVAPYEVMFLPTDTGAMKDNANLCPGPGGQPATPWRALVTFPSCDLVALIDLPSGTIIDSVHVDGAGDKVTMTNWGPNPMCPPVNDCIASSDAGTPVGGDAAASDAGDDGSADGASTDDGGSDGGVMAPDPGSKLPELTPRPTSIAITPTGNHAYVSLANASAILSLDVTPSSIAAAFTPSIPLDSAGGSNRIRLAVAPYTPTDPDKGLTGQFIGSVSKKNLAFLFVIARDGSVRMVDVLNPGSERECETSIDPLATPRPPSPESITNGCIPADQKLRRPFVRPGLRFSGIPVDIAFADVRPDDSREETVSGGYAWVITSSPAIYLINIDPVQRTIEAIVPQPQGTAPMTPVIYRDPPLLTNQYVSDPIPVLEPVVYPGTPRDRNFVSYSVSLDSATGPPRVDLPPIWSPTDTYLEAFWTKGTENDATALDGNFRQTYVFFPDPSAAGPQVWEVAWEGLLLGQRSSGSIRLPAQPDGSVALHDGGFCGGGVVVKGDIVTLNGCASDSQCPLGAVCHKDPTVDQVGGFTVTGLCVSPDTAKAATCTQLAGTLRRFDIVSVQEDQLIIQPHLDEIVRSNQSPCRIKPPGGAAGTGGAGGMGGGVAGAGGAAGVGGAGGLAAQPMETFDDCRDPDDPSGTKDFVCTTDTTTMQPRCLTPCRMDSECRAGRACLYVQKPQKQADGTFKPNPRFPEFAPDQGVCADAELIDRQECVPQYITYQVNAGRSFVVSGSSTGLLTLGGNVNAAGVCQPNLPTDLPPDQRMVSRIPIDVVNPNEWCDLPPPFVAKEPVGNGEQLFSTPASQATDAEALKLADARLGVVKAPLNPAISNPCYFMGGPSALDPVGTERAAITNLRARFQNTQIAFVLTNFERAPSTQTSFRLDVHGGTRAQTVLIPGSAEISMPARIVLGPFDARASVADTTYEAPYLFVVDQRRLGRGQGGGPTRGQLVRINPVGYEGTNGLQPIVEDSQRSGGLFPIQ